MTATCAKRLIRDHIQSVLNELEIGEALEVANWLPENVAAIVEDLDNDANFVEVASIQAFDHCDSGDDGEVD